MDASELLRERIQNAFGKLAYPGDDNIVVKTQYDYEVQAIEEELIGKHWHQIDPRERFHSKVYSALFGEDKTFSHNSTLDFLTPEAFRFYLPAFLIASLDAHPVDYIVDVTLAALTPSTNEMVPKRLFLPRIALLSPEQHEVTQVSVASLLKRFASVYRWNKRASLLREYWQIPHPD